MGTGSATFDLSIGQGEGMHMSGEALILTQSVLLPLHTLGLPAPLVGEAIATVKLGASWPDVRAGSFLVCANVDSFIARA